MQYSIKKPALILFLLLHIFFSKAVKADGLALIRDAEIEDFLFDITKPLVKAADLNPDDIKIYIVNDSALNAFVSGGQNIFIHTGLITKYKTPDVLIGVIAHETGHIAAGHLARSTEDMQKADNTRLLSYVLGLATAAIAGPDAGMALIMGGSQVAERTALKFNRTQEEVADSLALKYLDKTNNSTNGLLKLLEFFDREEGGRKTKIDEYALTHPVSKKRINFIRSNSVGLKRNIDPILQQRLSRIIVKLEAFLNDADQTLKTYNKNDLNSQYARSIAYYKKGKITQSLKIVDDLIKNYPTDNYLYDFKGQILFESGKLKESIIAYNQALKLNNNNGLARIALATAIINIDSKDKSLTDLAIWHLLTALEKEKNDISIYKQLSIAYNQNGDLGKSYLSLAELNLLQEDTKNIKKYVKLAKDNLDKNDKISLLRISDIEEFAKKIKDEKQK